LTKIEYYKSKKPIEVLAFFDTNYNREAILKKNNGFAENTDAPGKITSFYICGIVNSH